MNAGTKTVAANPITPSVLMDQLRLTLEDHPEGGNWMTYRGQASTAAAIGRFRVIFRLLAMFSFTRAKAEELKTELLAEFEKIRDDEAQLVFYRGMSMILRPRGVKLPDKPYLTGDDFDWHRPL